LSAPERYQPMAIDDIYVMLQALEEEFNDYLHYGLGYNSEQYVVSGIDVIDAIIRVDKRIKYFQYFHNMRINDEKKAALFSYWIAKLHPVKFIDDILRNNKAHANINEKLAINHLITALVNKEKIKLWDGENGIHLEKSKLLEDLIYSYRFRNFTIDSMIILADSINTESFRAEKKNL